ncbi:putative telomerase reverse transcriptase [Trypanosoma cruzi]|uniref:Putative telomerase reverse transcriptase n=1 Tax=Trypanosoma cruzi TaxID=5693 RepID=A0A2V2VAU1_TRYCR|nr:putative telomerase reverse transcriptase [Trypanosoma cruzi]
MWATRKFSAQSLSASDACCEASMVAWLLHRGSGRRRRSMIQQRVLLQFFFFLFQHVVPFLVRSSFHVTWSSKKLMRFSYRNRCGFASSVVNCDKSAFDAGEERRGRETVMVPPQPMALPPMALERLTSEKIVGLKMPPGKDAVPAVTTAPPLLYSSIRFLLDQRKLRPIARVRFANARWLLKMADGLCSPATPSVCNVSGRAVASTNRTKRSSAVSPTPRSCGGHSVVFLQVWRSNASDRRW